MNTETIIVVIILIIVLIPAFRGVIKHAKGEGECCGGPKEKRVRKKISGTKLYEYVVQIDGMHCINCRNSIEKHLDELDGVVAKVSLEKKQANVSCYRETDEKTIKETIENLDFKVVSIKKD